MIDNTIKDTNTIAASGKDVILAGRYPILYQQGQGGKKLKLNIIPLWLS